MIEKISIGGWDVTLRHAPPELIQSIEGLLRGDYSSNEGTLLKSSRHSRVCKFRVGESFYVFKEFLPRGAFEGLKSVFRGSRSKRALRAAVRLEEAGFLTPPIEAVGERRGMLGVSKDFMVTRFIEGSIGVNAFIQGPLREMEPEAAMALRRSLMRELGAIVGGLHAKGIVHGDLRPNNILLKGVDEGEGAVSLYLIDNESNKYFKRIPFELLVKNLVQINMIRSPFLNITDRMRFYGAYLTAFPRAGSIKKRLAGAVRQRTMERLERLRDRGVDG